MNRVLSYWRAGAYHRNVAAADGYAAGPALDAFILKSVNVLDEPQFSVTHSISNGQYTPGGTLIVSGQLTYSGVLQSLLWRPELPSGWTFNNIVASGTTEIGYGEILWLGATVPTSPINIEYEVQIPPGATGDVTLRNFVEVGAVGLVNPIEIYAGPDPMTVVQATQAEL